MLKKLMIILALSGSLFAMHDVELDLNDYDLDAQLNLDLGQFNDAVDPDTAFLGARYLRASSEHSDDDLTHDENLYDIHFFVKQRLHGTPDLTLGLGTKLVFTSVENEDFTALPIGALVDYELPLGLSIPFILGGSFYYSPQVLSWQDAKNYMEVEGHLDVRVIDRASITAGYRKIDTDFDTALDDVVFNEAWFIGVKFRF